MQAFHSWKNWFMAQKFQLNNNNDQQIQEQIVWKPPRVRVKCNVDVRFNNQRGTTNIRWCYIDCNSGFIMAGITWDVGCYTVIEVNALTLKEVVMRVIQLQMKFVTFESDSQLVLQAIRANYDANSEFRLIISSINSLLAVHSDFEVKSIKCQVNLIAQLLAKATNS